MSELVKPPFKFYTDLDGTPLEAGKIYIGAYGLNPEDSPILVYWDDALTEPASLPIGTISGYSSRSGSPGNVYVAGDYSIIVKDKFDRVVYSDLNVKSLDTIVNDAITGRMQTKNTLTELKAMLAAELTNGDAVSVQGYSTLGDGGGGLFRYTTSDISADVTIDTQNGVYVPLNADPSGASGGFVRRYSGRADVRWFGAVGDDSTHNLDAIQGAFDVDGQVLVPEGTFLVEDPGISVGDSQSILGMGRETSILKKVSGVGELDPIIRESYSGGVFEDVNDFTCEHIAFVGNGTSEEPSSKAAGLIRFYNTRRLVVRDCSFTLGRGYGLGLQGAPSATDESKRGPNTSALIENCIFSSNGKAEYLTVSDSDDGMDVKSSDNIVVRNCRFYDNGDKGLDVRGRHVLIEGCYSYDNEGSGISVAMEGALSGATSVLPSSSMIKNCWLYNNTLNGISIVPQVATTVLNAKGYVQIEGCYLIGNAHNIAVSSQGSVSLVDTRVIINGITSRDPSSSTNHVNCSAPLNNINVGGASLFEGGNHGIYVNSAQTGQTTVDGCAFSDLSGDGIKLPTDVSAVSGISGNTFNTIAGDAVTGASNVTGDGNSFTSITGDEYSLTGTNNKILDRLGSINVASAASLGANEAYDVWVITGSTNITQITSSWTGREIILQISGSCTIEDGGNLALAGDFVGTSSDILKLVCIGSNWLEVSRSVN